MSFSRGSVLCLSPGGFHRVSYLDWGRTANKHVVLCVHGLARNSRDFDFLAAAPAYLGLIPGAQAVGGPKHIDWVGTSMGGLIGMLLAAKPGSPIRRLVLRGVDSDVLTRITLDRMQAEKPDLQVVEFDGAGHAPALMDSGQIAAVTRFLLS